MALKIRLRRMGRKKAPTYRIVVAESSMPRDGRFVANLGHYNPRSNPPLLVVDRERTLEWIAQGATPTDTTQALLRRAGLFRPAPLGAVETVVETVKSGAKRTAGAVKGAAAAVAAAVSDAAEDATDAVKGAAAAAVDVVEDAVEAVRDRVAGEDEESGEAEGASGEGGEDEPRAAE